MIRGEDGRNCLLDMTFKSNDIRSYWTIFFWSHNSHPKLRKEYSMCRITWLPFGIPWCHRFVQILTKLNENLHPFSSFFSFLTDELEDAFSTTRRNESLSILHGLHCRSFFSRHLFLIGCHCSNSEHCLNRKRNVTIIPDKM